MVIPLAVFVQGRGVLEPSGQGMPHTDRDGGRGGW